MRYIYYQNILEEFNLTSICLWNGYFPITNLTQGTVSCTISINSNLLNYDALLNIVQVNNIIYVTLFAEQYPFISSQNLVFIFQGGLHITFHADSLEVIQPSFFGGTFSLLLLKVRCQFTESTQSQCLPFLITYIIIINKQVIMEN